MTNVTLETSTFRDFASGEVASEDTTAIDVERFKREIEIYLKDLREAVARDLQAICDSLSSS